MTGSELVHKLLYFALIEIRGYGHEMRHKGVFALADLFHNVPGNSERAAKEEITYSEVLANLHEKATERGYEKWLQNQIRHVNGCDQS